MDDDEHADFASIQAAVDAASPGATIIVRNGTYTENVDVDRAVTILSESGPEYTEVRAVNPKDSVFFVTADSVNISGFSVRGASELVSPYSYPTGGIWLYEVRDCNISGNVLSNNYCGLYVTVSENCTMERNRAESNNYGIYIPHRKGILLETTAWKTTLTTLRFQKLRQNRILMKAIPWKANQFTISQMKATLSLIMVRMPERCTVSTVRT